MVLATTIFLAFLGAMALQSSSFDSILIEGLAIAVFGATRTWVFYTAVEPYVRRHWPDSLTSWARLAGSRFRDPLVASHILAGIVAAGAVMASWHLLQPLLPPMAAIPWWQQVAASLSSSTAGLSTWIGQAGIGVPLCLALVTLVVILRPATRRLVVADVTASVLLSVAANAQNIGRPGSLAAWMAFFTIVTMVWIWLLRRFGFLSLLAAWITFIPAVSLPFQVTGWVASRTFPLQLIPVALAAWALWVILSSPRQASIDSVV
jgi:hypothetical protein